MESRFIWLVTLVLWAILFPLPGHTNDLNVVASIRPIHSLVSAVMGETGKPHLIVSGGQSPHLYSLKISNARIIQSADIIFWVGKGLESFLEKTIPSLNPAAMASPLYKSPGLTLYRVRESGAWDKPDPDDDVQYNEEIDMHIWLDPRNAIAIVREITRVLGAVDPDRTEIYTRNAMVEIARLEALESNIAAQLSEFRKTAFIQFHDAFQYLERRFSLRAVGAITLNPDRPVGAGRIRLIRELIVNSNVVCLFTEPQFEPQLAIILTEGLEVKTMSLDPIGLDFAPGTDLYFSLMKRNLATLKSCLGNV